MKHNLSTSVTSYFAELCQKAFDKNNTNIEKMFQHLMCSRRSTVTPLIGRSLTVLVCKLQVKPVLVSLTLCTLFL